jgi:hypothetical protein
MTPHVKQLLFRIGGGIICAIVAVKLLDLLMVWGIYSSIFQRVRDAGGLDDLLTGAISIGLTVIVLMLIPTAISAVFLRKTPKKLLLLGGAASAWMVLIYFLAQPKAGQYFNPMTGHAMYRYYREPDGIIKFLPLGYKYHPRYGTELQILTPEVVREMDYGIRPQQSKPSGSELRRPFIEEFAVSPLEANSNWEINKLNMGRIGTRAQMDGFWGGFILEKTPQGMLFEGVRGGPENNGAQRTFVSKREFAGDYDFTTVLTRSGSGMTCVGIVDTSVANYTSCISGVYWSMSRNYHSDTSTLDLFTREEKHQWDMTRYLDRDVSIRMVAANNRTSLYADGQLLGSVYYVVPASYRIGFLLGENELTKPHENDPSNKTIFHRIELTAAQRTP